MFDRVKESLEKFGEAFTACGLAMVQCDLSVLTLAHVATAAQVGALTAVAYFITLLLNIKFKYAPIWLTGALTTIADFIIHDSHFPAEHIATGLGAMALAFVFEKIRKKRNG